MSRIEIFRPVQNKPSMEGVPVTLGPQELQAIAAGYDPQLHEAPLVIGHPTHDAPAYGWVRSLSFADGALVMDSEQSPELQDVVRKGHFKKVSASFYTPGAPGNPTPGKWALRHVGFLGAQPPGIKGLKTVSFAEAEEGVVTFGDLPAYAGSYIARMFRGLRDWLIAEKGQEVADRILPDYEIESVRELSQRGAETPATTSIPGAFSFADPHQQPQEIEPMKTAQELQAELDASQRELQAMREREAARIQLEQQQATAMRHTAHVSFAEALIASARWPGGAKDLLVATLDHVATPAADAGVVSFGEGDQAKPLVAALQEQLQAMPPAVSFAEFARNGGQAVLTDREIADRAADYKARKEAAGHSISLSNAIDAVKSGADKA